MITSGFYIELQDGLWLARDGSPTGFWAEMGLWATAKEAQAFWGQSVLVGVDHRQREVTVSPRYR